MKTPVKLGRPPKPRPTDHDAEILQRLSAGESLRQICKTPGIPSAPTVRDWVLSDPAFAELYARARSAGCDAIAEEIQEIADDATNDFMDRQSKTGVARCLDAENVNRSRLRIDSRKWLLSKLRPEKYGDMERVQITGAEGGPVQTRHEVVFVSPAPVDDCPHHPGVSRKESGCRCNSAPTPKH